ncbi:hypothetical protein Btru_036999 [Bulinus truncatus]|nr:hypothetical protein Btru_036999 [Bulinus truncatus]
MAATGKRSRALQVPDQQPFSEKTSQLRKVAQSKSGDSESSPAKLFSNRSAFRRYVAPSRRGGKSSPLKTVMKTNKSWQHEASSDSEPREINPTVLLGSSIRNRPIEPGNRSETSIVCKRDSWIWFSPETKASDDDFISRQQKFKSEDPRVAELAEEIK